MSDQQQHTPQTPTKHVLLQPEPQRAHNLDHKRAQSSVNLDKIYVSSDGQVLLSSMVKAGSPTKRQLTGSASQVRFSLPPMSDDEDESIMSVEEEEDEREKKVEEDYQFNPFIEFTPTKKQPPQTPPNHRSTSSTTSVQTTTTDVFADSMRDLISSSPNRGKLLIRPQDMKHKNRLSLPIPVEVMLPPKLSPNRVVSGPRTLVYNGIDYEPFEKRFLTEEYRPRDIITIKSAPTSPAKEFQHEQIDLSLSIDDLSTLSDKAKKSEKIDNEFEIKNPSEKAIVLDNQLNRKFSFPPRQKSPEKPSLIQLQTPPRSPSLVQSKHLPALPLPAHTPVKQKLPTEGLGLFISEGSRSTPEFNRYGRFSQITNEIEQDREENDSPLKRSNVIYHRHQRSVAQSTDFNYEDLQNSQKDAEETVKVNQEQQEKLKESLHTETDASEDLISITSIKSNLSLEFSTDNSFQSITSQVETDGAHDTSSAYTAEQQPEVIEILDSDAETIELYEEVEKSETSYDLSLTSQLENLSVILTATNKQSEITAEELKALEKSIGSPSALFASQEAEEPFNLMASASLDDLEKNSEDEYEELSYLSTKDLESLPVLPVPATLPKSISTQSRLSYYPVPELFFKEDELQHLTVNLKTSSGSSPLMSQTSYETAESRPFSRCSADTDVTSIQEEPSQAQVMIDLTNDDYNVTYVKDPKYGNNVNSFKSVFQKLSNGEIRETIIIDDEEEKPTQSFKLTKPSPSLSSASHFSFETVASEVQLYSNTSKSAPTSPLRKRLSYTNYRRYTDAHGKTVIELCEDTMKSSRDVLDLLQRQKSVLISKNSNQIEGYLQRKGAQKDEKFALEEFEF